MSKEEIARDIFGITEADLLPGESMQEAMDRVLKETREKCDELERLVGEEKENK